MSDKPISPLRRRMIEDMTVRNFVEKTRNDYRARIRATCAAVIVPRATRTLAPFSNQQRPATWSMRYGGES
jgi:hypothetical protein